MQFLNVTCDQYFVSVFVITDLTSLLQKLTDLFSVITHGLLMNIEDTSLRLPSVTVVYQCYSR